MNQDTPAWIVRPILAAAIAANNALGEAFDSHSASNSVTCWLRDFRTIRLDIGQRTGKTRAMVELVGPQDTVITLQDEMIEYLKQGGCEANVMYTAKYVHTMATNREQAPLRHPVVWIDPASWVIGHHMGDGSAYELKYKDVLNVFGKDPQQQFILLG